MDCPNCGASLQRSRSRNFRETAIKKVTSYKTYRCHDCDWRGMVRPVRRPFQALNLKAIAIWVVGLLFAIAVGILGAELVR